MFTTEQKRRIAQAVEDVLLDIDESKTPKAKLRFKVQVYHSGSSWTWTEIIPNWEFAYYR